MLNGNLLPQFAPLGSVPTAGYFLPSTAARLCPGQLLGPCRAPRDAGQVKAASHHVQSYSSSGSH